MKCRFHIGPTSLLGILLLLSVLSACATESLDAGLSFTAPDVPACTSDGDCPLDQECVLAVRQCTINYALPYAISFNVTPPDASDANNLPPGQIPVAWVQTQLGGLEQVASHERNLTLATPIEVTGSIHIPPEWASQAVKPVSLVATTASDLPDWPDYRFTGVLARDGAMGGWRYRIHLLPDRAYRFTLFTNDSAYPPVIVDHFVSDREENTSFDLEAKSATILEGRLLFDDGQPVVGVRVVAIASYGGGEYASSSTDAAGLFELSLPAGVVDVELTARPSESFLAFPEQGIEGRYNTAALEGMRQDFVIPSLPPAHEVRFLIRDAASVPVANSALRVTGEVAGGLLSMELTSDDEGVALAQIYAGVYTWTATPPDFSRASVTQGTVTIDDERADLLVSLPDKRAIRLQVFDEASGDPVVGADLFLSLAALDSGPLDTDRQYHLVTGDDGGIEATVEEGHYNILVVPSATTHLPRYTVPDAVVGPSVEEVVIAVPQPWLLHGRVVDATGEPVPNASVQVGLSPYGYRHDGTDKDPETPSGGELPVETNAEALGEARTDDDGVYQILLPYIPIRTAP